MIPLPPKSWPPLIRNRAMSPTILWRDRLCMAAMWGLLIWLCRRSLAALFLMLHGLFAHRELVTSGWSGWNRLYPYLVIVGLLACWVVYSLFETLRVRQQALRKPPPPPLSPAEEADKYRITVDMLAQWRQLKICTVHFDAEGNPSVQGGG